MEILSHVFRLSPDCGPICRISVARQGGSPGGVDSAVTPACFRAPVLGILDQGVRERCCRCNRPVPGGMRVPASDVTREAGARKLAGFFPAVASCFPRSRGVAYLLPKATRAGVPTDSANFSLGPSACISEPRRADGIPAAGFFLPRPSMCSASTMLISRSQRRPVDPGTDAAGDQNRHCRRSPPVPGSRGDAEALVALGLMWYPLRASRSPPPSFPLRNSCSNTAIIFRVLRPRSAPPPPSSRRGDRMRCSRVRAQAPGRAAMAFAFVARMLVLCLGALTSSAHARVERSNLPSRSPEAAKKPDSPRASY
jgi:hypothetical protein